MTFDGHLVKVEVGVRDINFDNSLAFAMISVLMFDFETVLTFVRELVSAGQRCYKGEFLCPVNGQAFQ